MTLVRLVFGLCIIFYTLFYGLEDIGELDVNSPVDVYSLHFVFIPIIHQHLDMFHQG